MALKPYEDVADEALSFPIKGKVYTPPAIGLKTGALLTMAMEGKDDELLKKESRSLWQMVLGPVYDEMFEDDVDATAVARAGFTVLVDFQAGRAAAESFWESGLDPEVLAAMTAALQEGDDSTTSPSTDAAESSTKRPANTSATRSRKTSRTPSQSRSRKSSNSGIS